MSTPKSILHEAALRYAAQGIPVFPCVPGGKSPATANGFKDATTDPIIIDLWWTENPDYNPAMSPDMAGLHVVDVEQAALDDWEIYKGPTPDTKRVGTPNGGEHLYFKGSAVSSVRKLLGKQVAVDTRGIGGYVLLPPSLVMAKDGSGLKPYVELNDVPAAELPSWITTALAPTANKVEASGAETDTPGEVTRARSHLHDLVRRGDVAVSGKGGNDRTYALSAELRKDFGLSHGTALVLLEEIWNPACVPPWERAELSQIITNAGKHGQNGEGAYATRPAAEAFAATAAHLPPELLKPAPKSRFWPRTVAEMNAQPDPRYVVHGWIMAQSTVVLYGPSNSFKSFIALDLAMSVATGITSLFKPLVTGPVFYGILEGRASLEKSRRRAWQEARGIGAGKEDIPFYTHPAPTLKFADEVVEYGDMIQQFMDENHPGQAPAMIFLDTVAKMMTGLDETKDSPLFARFCDNLRDRFGCPVVGVHHSGHDVSRGPRSSTNYYGNADAVVVCEGIVDTRSVRISMTKQKDGPNAEPLYAIGSATIGSLAFEEVTVEEYDTLNPQDGGKSEIDKLRVGAILVRAGAHGKDNCISHNTLAHGMAMELRWIQSDSTMEQQQQAVTKMSRLLASLASKRDFRPYNERLGGTRVWFLPVAETEQAPQLKS